MDFLKRIFKKKRERETKPLRIDGIKTAMTPQPDDAELAAQALLESMSAPEVRGKREKARGKKGKAKEKTPQEGTPEYYRQLAEKIRASRAAEARLTMRYLAYCEEQLALPKELYNGQIGEMEQELYKRQDIAEREGGELLRRWQHCLAEVIVRQMSAVSSQAAEQEDAVQGL